MVKNNKKSNNGKKKQQFKIEAPKFTIDIVEATLFTCLMVITGTLISNFSFYRNPVSPTAFEIGGTCGIILILLFAFIHYRKEIKQ